MADLSHLLGAVYGDDPHGPDGPSVAVEPPAGERLPDPPDWADDAHLDAAFADWTPGPPDEAPASERAVIADTDDAADTHYAPVEDQEPDLDPQPVPLQHVEAVPLPAAPPVHVARVWQRSDDDILPERKAKGLRISLPLRRG